MGRPPIDGEIRELIRQMSMANPLWGAPRIHGELLMLGIQTWHSQPSRNTWCLILSRPPSQNWKTFLRNQAAGIASIDLFVVPTAFFKLLYGLVILGHERRQADRVWGHCSSDRRMDRPTGDRGFPLG